MQNINQMANLSAKVPDWLPGWSLLPQDPPSFKLAGKEIYFIVNEIKRIHKVRLWRSLGGFGRFEIQMSCFVSLAGSKMANVSIAMYILPIGSFADAQEFSAEMRRESLNGEFPEVLNTNTVFQKRACIFRNINREKVTQKLLTDSIERAIPILLNCHQLGKVTDFGTKTYLQEAGYKATTIII